MLADGESEKNIPHLRKDVLNKIDDQELGELILGTEKGIFDKKVGIGGKIFAVILWLTSLGIESTIESTDSSEKIMGLSTLGLILVVTRLSSSLSKYSGPVWPLAGRFGQRIDKPTPPIILRFFGWLLLVVSLIIFIGIFLQK